MNIKDIFKNFGLDIDDEEIFKSDKEEKVKKLEDIISKKSLILELLDMVDVLYKDALQKNIIKNPKFRLIKNERRSIRKDAVSLLNKSGYDNNYLIRENVAKLEFNKKSYDFLKDCKLEINNLIEDGKFDIKIKNIGDLEKCKDFSKNLIDSICDIKEYDPIMKEI